MTGEQQKKKVNLATQEGAKVLCEDLKQHASRVLRRFGTVRPFSVVVARRDLDDGSRLDEPSVVPVATDSGFQCDHEKDLYAKAVADLIIAADAIGVGMVFESWFHRANSCDDVDRFKRWREQNPSASLGEYEGAEEVVFLRWEHVTTGVQTWLAPIERDGEGNPHVGTFERLDTGGVEEGRFAELLPPTAYGPVASA